MPTKYGEDSHIEHREGKYSMYGVEMSRTELLSVINDPWR